jgi:MFS family permease
MDNLLNTITTSTLLTVIAGFLILLLGRRLFWLFVGVLGFIWGMNLATQYLVGQSQWVVIVIGLVAGLIGAVLAIVFQRVAVAIAGFFAGFYLAGYLMTFFGVDMGQFALVIQIIGGIIGAVLLFVLFDWALIVISSLIGASLIAPVFTPDSQIQMVVFLILVVIGIIVQAGIMARYPTTRRTYYRRRVRS